MLRGAGNQETRYNTGPKAVLQDFCQFQRDQMDSKQQETLREIENMKRRGMNLQLPETELIVDEKTEDETMRTSSLQQRPMPTQDSMLKHRLSFGNYRHVSPGRFTELVEEYTLTARPSTQVPTLIVHLADGTSPECLLLDAMLDQLAGERYGYALFLRVEALEADLGFDRIVLPTLLIYRNGDLLVNLSRVLDTILDCNEPEKEDDEQEFDSDDSCASLQRKRVGADRVVILEDDQEAGNAESTLNAIRLALESPRELQSCVDKLERILIQSGALVHDDRLCLVRNRQPIDVSSESSSPRCSSASTHTLDSDFE